MKLAINTNDQQQMREAFYDGAPGILVSGLVWACAALLCYAHSVERGIYALLIGGMAIHPIATLLTKALGRTAATPKGNALPILAGTSTLWLIVCCAMAFGLSRNHPSWFFPAMMAVIGARYMVFSSLFGRASYLIIGGVLISAGTFALLFRLPPAPAAALGSMIEIVSAVVVFRASKSALAP